jgi:hypothetical protein
MEINRPMKNHPPDLSLCLAIVIDGLKLSQLTLPLSGDLLIQIPLGKVHLSGDTVKDLMITFMSLLKKLKFMILP